MDHYSKLAFITFRIIGSLVAFYSLLSLAYVLLTIRYVLLASDAVSGGTTVPSTGAAIARFMPVAFYLLLGLLIFAFSRQLAKLAVKGIDHE